MIRKDYRIIGDIKRYVKEASKKIIQDIKRNTNEIRSIRTKVSRLEKMAHRPREFVTCKQCRKEIKEANKHIQSLGDETI